MHPMVLQLYIWRHLLPVHGIYSMKVQWCHSCIWWLWKYEYKRYDTSERSKGKAGATVTVAANMITTMKNDQILASQKNKQQFIFMLNTELEKSNCKTYHVPGDADILIVQKAVQSVTTSKTVLVGEGTDLIVLLCYHSSLDSHDLFFEFFRPEPKKIIKNLRVCNIRATKENLGQNTHLQ